WLHPALDGVDALSAVGDGALEQGLRALIPWDRQRALDTLAPARLETPLGSAAIDYAAEGGPRVDIRVQELFGVKTHPMVGGGRAPRRRPGAGAVRSENPSGGRRRPGPPDPGPVVARSAAGAGDEGPAGFLGRVVGGGQKRDARPLSAPPLARRPPQRRRHH